MDPGSCLVLCWAESMTDAWPGAGSVPGLLLSGSHVIRTVNADGQSSALYRGGNRDAGTQEVRSSSFLHPHPIPLETVSSVLGLSPLICLLSQPLRVRNVQGQMKDLAPPSTASVAGLTYMVRVKAGHNPELSSWVGPCAKAWGPCILTSCT